MSIEQTAPVPLNNLEQIAGKITDLQLRLQTAAPGYESLLHEIHVALHKDESLAHLLTDEQVGVIVRGLSLRKNIIIAEAENKGKTKKLSNGKSLKDVTMADL